MTATCDACGPVAIEQRRDGQRIKYVCAVGRKQSRVKSAENAKSKLHGLRKYEADLLKLGKVCEICGSNDNLVIDHSHNTGEIRGVLCRACNLALGYLGDGIDLERIKAVLTYARKHGC